MNQAVQGTRPSSLVRADGVNAGCFPVQNLRSKKCFHTWKCLAIPTVTIACSFENRTLILETPNILLKGK